MRYTRGLLTGALALIVGANAAFGEPAEDLLAYVPEGTEAVVGVDLDALTALPAFDEAYERLDTAKFEAGASQIESFTGVDLLRDVQAIVLLGELKNQGEGALIIRGTWDMQSLVGLVYLNPTYTTQATDGPDIHIWENEDDGKTQHAAFLREDTLVLSESYDRVQSIVAASLGQTPSLAQAGSQIPAPQPLAFALAYRPQAPRPDITENPVLGKLQAVALGCVAQDDALVVCGKALASAERDAAALTHTARGLIAVGELLDNEAVAPWEVTTAHQGRWVEARTRIPLDTVIRAAAAAAHKNATSYH